MRLMNWAAMSVIAGMSSCSLAVATAPVTTMAVPHTAKTAPISALAAVVTPARTPEARRT
jgi:hypothetical protein